MESFQQTVGAVVFVVIILFGVFCVYKASLLPPRRQRCL
jgi:hypothetical protein